MNPSIEETTNAYDLLNTDKRHLHGKLHKKDVLLNIPLLDKLPPEILLYLATFLNDVSAALFALSSKSLYYMFITERWVWNPLKFDINGRYELLHLLERDLPNHIVCFDCARLHSIEEAECYCKQIFYDHGAMKCQQQYLAPGWTFTQTANHITYPFVQIAMKLQRQKMNFSKLLDLLEEETQASRRFGDYTGQATSAFYKLKARIIEGKFLFRVKMAHKAPSNLLWLKATRTSTSCDTGICEHLCILLNYFNREHGYVRRRDLSGKHSEIRFGRPGRCLQCKMEFQIDYKRFREGSALFVTKWTNLGEGLSSQCREWRDLFSPINLNLGLDKSWEYANQPSISEVFERGASKGQIKMPYCFKPQLSKQEKRELFSEK